jgi:hypothetical protein
MTTGRKVTNGEEARQLLQQWEQSGEAVSTWCRQQGINRYSLSAYKGWSRRSGVPEFVEVELLEDLSVPVDEIEPIEEIVEPFERPQSIAQAEDCVYRIGLGNELSIEVTDSYRDDTLRRLIGVVASC